MQGYPNSNIKIKTSVLLFGKGWAAPLVLYFDDPKSVYEEIKANINSPSKRMLEYSPNGPIKQVCVLTSEITGVALQEEQHLS